MPDIPQAWLALIGAVLGGSGLKFIEHWLTRPRLRDDAATAFRNELRVEMNNLRAELKAAETDLDMWKAKYYDILERLSQSNIARDEALHKIQDSANKALERGHNSLEKKEIQHARDLAADELKESEKDV